MAEVSALAAVSAAESNVKDAEDEVKRITESKARNAKSIAAANAAMAAAKGKQDKATADLAAAKLAQSKSTARPLAVMFSADAQRVASLMDDNTLRVWAVVSGAPIEETAAAQMPVKLTANADGTFTASRALTLSTGSSPTWMLERTLNDKTWFADRVNAVDFSPDGKTLAAGSGELSRSGDIVLINLATSKSAQIWKERHADAVLCLDFSPDGRLLAPVRRIRLLESQKWPQASR